MSSHSVGSKKNSDEETFQKSDFLGSESSLTKTEFRIETSTVLMFPNLISKEGFFLEW